MTQDTIDQIKGIIVGTAGIVAIQLPTWFEILGLYLGAFKGYLEFTIGCCTLVYLYYGIKYRKNKNGKAK